MDKEIASGWYSTEDGRTTSVAHWLEEDDFAKNGGVMNHEMVDGITKRGLHLLLTTPVSVGSSSRMVSLSTKMKYPWLL